MRGDGDAARPIRPSEVGVDRVLVGAVLALAAFGMVMVYSSGAVFAAKRYGDATYFLKRELVYAIIGLGAMSFAARVDYSIYRKLAYPLLFVSLVLLAAVLKLGSRAGGAIRWFRAGPLSFQPSELAKFALCVYLAYLLARKAEKVRVFSVGFLPPLLVTGVMMVLLLKQPDLGTAAIFGAVALGLLFVAGTRTSYLMLAVLVAAPAGWTVHRVDAVPHAAHAGVPGSVGVPPRRRLPDHRIADQRRLGRRHRAGARRRPAEAVLSARGAHRLHPLHRRRGAGAAGCAVRDRPVRRRWSGAGCRTAFRARDVFGAYLAFGITTMFGLQALVNIGVVLGSLPTKGLPLPFISYGGTSLVMSLFRPACSRTSRRATPSPATGCCPARAGARSRAPNRRMDAGPRIIVEVGDRPRRPEAPRRRR